jgi:hypothetical protein
MTGAAADPRVPLCRRLAEDDHQIRARIRAEYEEMPGLCLTVSQAARLFDLDPEDCARVLNSLVAEGTIWTNGREFLGRRTGRHCA